MSRARFGGFAVRAIVVTLLAFLVASIGSIAYTYQATGERATATIHTRLAQLLATVESTLKVACYIKDAQLATEVAEGLMSNPEILGVTIRADQDVLASLGSHDVPLRNQDGMDKLTRAIASPFGEKLNLGEVSLTANPDVIAHMRSADIQLALRQLILQLSFVLMVIVAALAHFFIRPITRLSMELHRMDPAAGEHLAVPRGHENTEIGQLVRDVNELSDRLVLAMHESEKARDHAEAASAAKGAFLANMSHEIRTPMNAVLGLARIGCRDSADAASRSHFMRILASGEHLLGVLNDILDFSRIEAGKLEIESTPLNLLQLIHEAGDLVSGRCAEKGLEFTVDTAMDLPVWVAGDALRIRQILVNLLSNAIKFTERGAIGLAVDQTAQGIRFTVSDAGIGMTEEQLGRVFLPFEQANNETTRKYGGTGLGLAISLQLAQRMGGELRAQSRPGAGSRFTLCVPLPEASAPAANEMAPPANSALAGRHLAGLRVLAAEDIDINRFILEDMLCREGAQCRFATNGLEAVNLMTDHPQDFDIVLMDIQMPEMDGHEATRLIREKFPDVPVIGLTAHALKSELDKCLASGMTAHLSKPIEPVQLVATIRQWAGDKAPSAAMESLTPRSEQRAPTQPFASIDWQVLSDRFRDHPAVIDKLLRKVAEQHPDTSAQLRALAATSDYPALKLIAHNLKGTFGNLAATAGQTLATRLDEAALGKEPSSHALAHDLADFIDRLCTDIDNYFSRSPSR